MLVVGPTQSTSHTASDMLSRSGLGGRTASSEYGRDTSSGTSLSSAPSFCIVPASSSAPEPCRSTASSPTSPSFLRLRLAFSALSIPMPFDRSSASFNRSSASFNRPSSSLACSSNPRTRFSNSATRALNLVFALAAAARSVL